MACTFAVGYDFAVDELNALAFRLLNQIPSLRVVLEYGVSYRLAANRTNCCQIVLGHRRWLSTGSEDDVLQQAIRPAIAFASTCVRAIYDVKTDAHVRNEKLEFRNDADSEALQLWRNGQCLATTARYKEMSESVSQLYLYVAACDAMQRQ